MREVLAGGNLPPNMRAQAGWIGGFKTLVGQEIRRDPLAIVTLSSNLHLVEQGQLKFQQVFTNAAHSIRERGHQSGDEHNPADSSLIHLLLHQLHCAASARIWAFNSQPPQGRHGERCLSGKAFEIAISKLLSCT